VRTRGVLTLLVVLGLIVAVLTMPAASTSLQRTSGGAGTPTISGAPTVKDGEGEGTASGNSGDDDRWGNTETAGNGVDRVSNGQRAGDEVNNLSSDLQLLGLEDVILIELRALFGYLAILL
jgi:hypothetical protein